MENGKNFTRHREVSQYPKFGYWHSDMRQFTKFSIDLLHWRQYWNFVSRRHCWMFSGDLMMTWEFTRTLTLKPIHLNAANLWEIFKIWVSALTLLPLGICRYWSDGYDDTLLTRKVDKSSCRSSVVVQGTWSMAIQHTTHQTPFLCCCFSKFELKEQLWTCDNNDGKTKKCH